MNSFWSPVIRPSVANVSVQGSTLTITTGAAGTAHISVLGFGSDGKTATESFAVNVTSPPPPPPPHRHRRRRRLRHRQLHRRPRATTPRSILTPTASGRLPASAIAGQKIKIQQTVSLLDSSSNVAQKELVTLSLSTTTDASAPGFTIASAAKQVKLKAGKEFKLNLSAKQISASVPAGTYHVLVSVTDPVGSNNDGRYRKDAGRSSR